MKLFFNNRYMRGLAAGAIAALFLSACQAPLDLSGVAATRKAPLRRTDTLQAAVAVSGGTVFVGNDGVTIFKPGNGDAMQRSVIVPKTGFAPDLIAVSRCPGGQLYALGADKTLWTRDGDGGWRAGKVDVDEDVLTLTCAPDGALWVGAGFATLVHSRDGGKSWKSISFDDDLQFTEVHFPDARTGYALGEFGTVMKTTDGGATWSKASGPTSEFYPLSAWFADAGHGWAGSLDGATYMTTDGAQSWQHESTGTTAPIYGLTGVGDQVYAVGNFGVFLHRAPGQWKAVESGSGTKSYLRALSFSGAGDLDFAGQGFVGVKHLARADGVVSGGRK